MFVDWIFLEATPNLKKGEKLDGEGGFCARGKLITSEKSKEEKILPLGLSDNAILKRDIKKDEVIKKFEKNEINILVSTTVVEVGIDIPNATVMLVEHAERFGLTQLHQLRGRVGRGANKSYCILVRRSFTETSKNRLSIMENTNDGFVIADEDLKLRGPGEFFGLRQSGFFQFKIADMVQDGSLLRQARSSAFNLIDNDQSLELEVNKSLKEYF